MYSYDVILEGRAIACEELGYPVVLEENVNYLLAVRQHGKRVLSALQCLAPLGCRWQPERQKLINVSQVLFNFLKEVAVL